MPLSRLPIPAPPAQHEILASYLARLARLHGMPSDQLWEQVSIPRVGTRRREVHPDRLAALVRRTPRDLARALPELAGPQVDWVGLRHAPQPGCPRCDVRHAGGRVHHLLPHHRYVCTTHRYWVGPPDIDQVATRLPGELDDIVRAQHHHQRLVRRHGAAAVFDAVLTGFLICGHLWAGRAHEQATARHEWAHRAELLIPTGTELGTFSASRVFAAVYPETVALAAVIASPAWRRMATSDRSRQRLLLAEVARRLGATSQSLQGSNAITHWMEFGASRHECGS